jgi:hypothetical protein
MMMETVDASETSVYLNETTRRYTPEGCHLHTRRRQNLKSQQNKILKPSKSYQQYYGKKTTVFWDLVPCILSETDVSEACTASINTVKPLRPTDIYMYHLLQQSVTVNFICTYFIRFSLKARIISLNSVNQLIFVMVKCGVLFEVRTGFLNVI